VIDAMGPRAKEIGAKADADYERRWAESKEVDEWGARRDQRGFSEAKVLLHDVHLFQHGYCQRHGRFAPDRQALDPTDSLLGKHKPELHMRVNDEASEYWAWVKTPTGTVFGLAARGGDFNDWWVFVADEEGPTGGPDTSGWQHILEADFADW
jgi:hypothetical protein